MIDKKKDCNMSTFVFYVGILPGDDQKVLDHLSNINEFNKNPIAKVKGTFDDPGGYYEYVVDGTLDAYKSFLNLSFVKSLNHYEE